MGFKRDKEKDTEIIKKYLAKYTTHNPDDVISVRRGIKCTYEVRIKDNSGLGFEEHGCVHEVNFWFTDGGMLFYGIVGWGISSSVEVKTLEE